MLWIERPVMTREEIARYNACLLERPGAAARLYVLDRFRRGVSREEVLGEIMRSAPAPRACPPEAFARAVWEALWENCALPCVPPRVYARWGVCVHRASLRALPSAAPVWGGGDRYDDRLQLSAVLCGEPLALLHTSADGRFYFAAAAFYMGWIAVEDVGECGGDAWRAEQEGAFLRVTGSRVTLCADPYEPRVRGLPLTMGTRLPLAAPPGTVREVRGRMAYDAYLALLPVRGRGGRLERVEALVPVSADICVGDLPYTRRSLARQMAKTRGEVYGWGGQLDARDCSARVGEIYRCFGFQLPRDASGLAQLPGAQSVMGWSEDDKRALLRTLPVGTILYFPGHVMLSYGTERGEPLCLSAVGRFLPPESAGDTARAVNTVAVTPLTVRRADGRAWLESLTAVMRIPPEKRGETARVMSLP